MIINDGACNTKANWNAKGRALDSNYKVCCDENEEYKSSFGT